MRVLAPTATTDPPLTTVRHFVAMGTLAVEIVEHSPMAQLLRVSGP